MQTNVTKLKELQPEMPQTESYTYIDKKTSVDYQLKEEHLRKLEKEEQVKAAATPLFRTKDI